MNRLRCPESDPLGAAARNPGRRPAFLITGVLGLAWVLVGKIFYYPPESHPNIGEAERTLAAKSQECHAAESSGPEGALANWGSLLARRHTRGIILGRALTDSVWFFVTDWFAIFLVARDCASKTRWRVSGFPSSPPTSATSSAVDTGRHRDFWNCIGWAGMF